jgi:uncharacterized repeat protein (TIGR03833 family)
MNKKPNATLESTTGALTHSPFAGLATRPDNAAIIAKTPSNKPVKRVAAAPPWQPSKLRVRLESTGRSGKVVTRISGLPPENLEAIASRLRKALGCGATVEESDVVLLGTLAERASQWLDNAGDLRMIAADKVVPNPIKPPSVAIAKNEPKALGLGTRRSDIRRGQRVSIVMKADQSDGQLTEGIVRDVLTNSEMHPRGIKVRLESGEIGRVKILLG